MLRGRTPNERMAPKHLIISAAGPGLAPGGRAPRLGQPAARVGMDGWMDGCVRMFLREWCIAFCPTHTHTLTHTYTLSRTLPTHIPPPLFQTTNQPTVPHTHIHSHTPPFPPPTFSKHSTATAAALEMEVRDLVDEAVLSPLEALAAARRRLRSTPLRCLAGADDLGGFWFECGVVCCVGD